MTRSVEASAYAIRFNMNMGPKRGAGSLASNKPQQSATQTQSPVCLVQLCMCAIPSLGHGQLHAREVVFAAEIATHPVH